MENLTFEQCSRVYDRLGGFKTADSFYTLFIQKYLEVGKVEPGDRRYSKYQYRVLFESFIGFLKSRGFEDEEIQEALPKWG